MNRTLLTAISLIGVGVVFGVVLMTTLGENALEKVFAAEPTLGAQQAPVSVPPAVRALNDQFVSVADAVTKSVVFIDVKTESKQPSMNIPQEFFRFFGPDGEQDLTPPEGEAAGSGVIISTDGYIVTNNHVVEHAKDGGITVTTIDQKEYKAKLVGRDPLTDLAVIKIEGSFTPAHFAQRSMIHVGEWVIAVGSPLGLKSTVTSGIISAMGRGIGIVGTNERSYERNRYAVENFIQTDAAINPGNSGGGLFNLEGSLVGINTAIASRSGVNAGYGFAIPIDMVRSVAEDLIDDGKIERGYIGVEISSVDETTAKAVGLDRVSGVQVNRVVKGGAAASAGVEVGDVVLEVDGQEVRTSNDLQNQIVLRRAGDKVKLTLWRNGKQITKTVTLRSLDGEGSFAEAKSGDSQPASSDEPEKFKGLGFTVSQLTSAQRKEFDTDNGVIVTDVQRTGPTSRRGLKPNTVIIKADGKAVNSPAELRRILSSKRVGDGVLFVVKDKDGSKTAVTVEVPEENS
ncbi:MAG: Do family serine endopeptidase [Bradyrhizobiaceae bacterium]|nr:Do family serine endopeptidase [Bradyrhizobiaceae bacterium]